MGYPDLAHRTGKMAAEAGAARAAAERAARPLLPAVLHAAVPLAVAAGWALSLRGVRLEDMNDLGLVSVLPAGVFVALFVLTASFALALARRPLHPLVPLLHIVVLIVLLYGITGFVEPEPRFATVFKHAGVIDYIARHRAVDPTIDAYFSWPGFFALGTLLTQAAGLPSAVSIAAWGPLVFNLLFLAPLVVIFRWASDDPRVTWLGLWIFFSANWVAVDYVAPQAVGYALWLAMLAALLWGFAPRLARLRGPVVAGGAAVLEHVPAARLRRGGLVLAVLLMYAAAVSGHQLTPFPALLIVAGLVVFARLETRLLPVVMLVMLAAWISFMTGGYLAGHIHDLTGPIGSLGRNINENVGSRVSGSAQHQRIVEIRLIASAGIWLLALWGFARRAQSGRVDVAMCVIGASPFLLPVLQPYGGEMLLRVFLFTLPAMAFFIAALVFPRAAAGGGWTGVAAALLTGSALLAAFQFTRYGNERLDAFTRGDVAAVHALYRLAPPGSTLIAGTTNLPWRYRDYANYDYELISNLTSWRPARPDPRRITRDVFARAQPRGAYVIFTRSTGIGAALLEGRPGVLDRVAALLARSRQARVVYRGLDGEIFFVRALA